MPQPGSRCRAPPRTLSSAMPRNSRDCSATTWSRLMPPAPKSWYAAACRLTPPTLRAFVPSLAISTRTGGRRPAQSCGACWSPMLARSVDSFRLNGKTALVTGAGRGIGRAVALALATAGAELILVSRTKSELDEVAREITREGGKARVVPFDVTDIAALRAAFSGIVRLDILVNNAGLNRPQPFLEVDEATLDQLLTLNVRAAFLVAQAAARRMVPQCSGVIVNMSSQMGHVGSE